MKTNKILILTSVLMLFTVSFTHAQKKLLLKVQRDSLSKIAQPAAPVVAPLNIAPAPRVTKEQTWTVRNAFETADEQADPANASFTLNNGKANTYLIDVGVLYDFEWLSNHHSGHVVGNSIGPFAVFSRNTTIGKEQNMIRGGGDYGHSWGTIHDGLTRMNYINSTLQYQRNKTDTTHSLLATAYYSFKFADVTDDHKFFVNAYHALAKNSSFFYNLYFNTGLEFQKILQAGAGDPTGLQARLYGNTGLSLALFHQGSGQVSNNKYTWPKLFELTVDYTSRYAYANTEAGQDRYIPLFKPSLTYYPLMDNNLSVGLSYNNGADPVAGIAQQKFWMLAIQFQK